MNLNSIRAFLAKGNRAKWFVFTLFCLILFIKTMIFHLSVGFEVKHLASGHVIAFLVFWSGKIAPILFLGSFVFIAKRQWWTIIINIIIDLWAIANLFYFKANNLFLSVDMVMMADNLDGFWDSLYSYLGWDIYSYILLSILYALTMLIVPLASRKTILFLFFALSSLIVICGINVYGPTKFYQLPQSSFTEFLKQEKTYRFFHPYGSVCHEVKTGFKSYDGWASQFIMERSIICFLPNAVVYYIASNNHEKITLNDDDIKKIELIINHNNSDILPPKTNILFVLFESLESWPLYKVGDFCYMPNLIKLANHKHTLYCDNVTSQIRHGHSADGQMICATGLLPISQGAACRLYGENEFPNFAHFFRNSAIINPCHGVWQQSTVTYSYKFNELIEPQKECCWHGDEFTLKKMVEYSTTAEGSFCVLGITIDTHTPFELGLDNPVHVETEMPSIMSAYLNSLHYTDSCIGKLLDTIFNSHLAENTTVVITGDHTIFRNESAFKDMTEYAQENGINFRSGHTFTPLIIYSPEIEGNIHVTDTCYQMDIFPTILNLIGAEDYFWHGFGVNVMDSVARHNRPITEQEAYRLSDLMIRSDYFRNYYNSADSAGNDR